MSEPIALTRKGTDEVVAWACGECRYVAKDEAAARECCAPYDCSGGCGAKLPKRPCYRTICDACSTKKEEAREAAKYEKAQKVALADYQGDGLFIGDEWFHDFDDLVDSLDAQDREVPAWAWGCYPIKFSIDADRIIESALDEHHEEAGDDISNAARIDLQTLLDEWCAAQKVISYACDEGVAVLLPKPPPEPEETQR